MDECTMSSRSNVEQDDPWQVAYCAEVRGANSQGKTREEYLSNILRAGHRNEIVSRSVYQWRRPMRALSSEPPLVPGNPRLYSTKMLNSLGNVE